MYCRLIGLLWLFMGIVSVHAAEQRPDARHVTVAEGYTSESATNNVEFTGRMFTASNLEGACQAAVRPVAFVVQDGKLELTAGTPFRLNTLVILANDQRGRTLGRFPVAIEVEEQQPPIGPCQCV